MEDEFRQVKPHSTKKTDPTITILTMTGPIYTYIMLIVYFCYFIVFFGIYSINPNYIRILSISIHVIVCIILIIRFNPLRKNITLHPYDRMIIFGSTVFLLTNVVATEVGLGTFTEKYLNSNMSAAKKMFSTNNTFSLANHITNPVTNPMKNTFLSSWWTFFFPVNPSKNGKLYQKTMTTLTDQTYTNQVLKTQQLQKQKEINPLPISHSI